MPEVAVTSARWSLATIRRIPLPSSRRRRRKDKKTRRGRSSCPYGEEDDDGTERPTDRPDDALFPTLWPFNGR
ncbi:unnamed protein product [Heligmosomoides polygyrus]|uniref:Uncharacterized protein n=1 Tax=Heligmosomoides polygyrus TaxID=6339 RepID=A0A183FGL9_HELPZ|nr:unnamed protein product [Heligmosomoides polygyrus]